MNKLYILALFLYSSLVYPMEMVSEASTFINSENLQEADPIPDCTAIQFISFIEAFLAGHRFCFDKSEQHIIFKHYKMDDKYNYSLEELKELFAFVQHNQKTYCNPLVKHVIAAYNILLPTDLDAATLSSTECLHEIQNIRFEECKKNETTKTNVEFFQQALNSDTLQVLKDISHKAIPYSYIPLRDLVTMVQMPLVKKVPHAKRIIALHEALFAGENLTIDNNSLSCKSGGKKNTTYTINMADKSGFEAVKDILMYSFLLADNYQDLLKKMYKNQDYTGYRLLLRYANENQKKCILAYWRFLQSAQDPLGPNCLERNAELPSKTALKKKLSGLAANQPLGMDGYKKKYNSKKYRHALTKRNKKRLEFFSHVAKYCDLPKNNTSAQLKFLKNIIEHSCNKQLYVEYVPFIQDLAILKKTMLQEEK